MTVDQELQTAVQHHQAGRFGQAEAIYRRILTRLPNHPDTLHLLGVLSGQVGQRDLAVTHIRRAVELRPNFVEAYSNLGRLLAEQGDIEQAIAAYRRVTQLRPEDTVAWYSLGLILKMGKLPNESIQCLEKSIKLNSAFAEAHWELGKLYAALGRSDNAIRHVRKAITINPNYVSAIGTLGALLKQQGKLDDAIATFRQGLEVDANSVDLLVDLGVALFDGGDPEQAILHYRRAIQIKPGNAVALNMLGIALSRQGKFDEAISNFKATIAIRPDMAQAHSNLGNALYERGKVDEAIVAHRKAIEADPGYASAHSNLGQALKDQGDLVQAEVSFRRAIELSPGDADAYNNLGLVFKDQGRVDESIALYRRAVELDPNHAAAHSNLGALKERGDLEQGLASVRRAIALDPKAPEIHSNLVLDLHFHPGYSSADILQEAKVWAAQHTRHFARKSLHAIDRSSDRKLKIGYVSADFTYHPVGRFSMPFVEGHDRSKFEVHCFSNVSRPDAATGWFSKTADRWHQIRSLSDAALAELIVQEQIDILVDLTLHTAGNRLLVFAQKPAPVQVTYLAYCSTSGLETIDYLLTDPWLLPAESDFHFTEKPFRLPHTYWCYRALPFPCEPGELPALSKGTLTFGCLNNFGKVSDETFSTWCKLLIAVPRSRLLLHSKEGEHRKKIRDRLADAGVDQARVDFVGYVPLEKYLPHYQLIDIGLDPFPFAGGTTTCDALWMGVPVVSLAGQTPVSRGGLCILSNVGLPDLVTTSTEEYIRVAVDLASDLPRLAQLRATMRQRMQSSPLMNEKQYVADLESAYRTMWHTWCGEQNHGR